MAKQKTVTQRVGDLEQWREGLSTQIEDVQKEVAKTNKWLHNGLGDKIANSIKVALAEQWDQQFKFHQEQNRVNGQKKDRRITLLATMIPVILILWDNTIQPLIDKIFSAITGG